MYRFDCVWTTSRYQYPIFPQSGLIDGFLCFKGKGFSDTQRDFVRANIEQVNGQEDKTVSTLNTEGIY